MTTRTERRRALRARTPEALRMSLGGVADAAHVKDISSAGVCCTTERPLPLLSVVQVTFLLPAFPADSPGEGRPTEVTCTEAVVRSVRDGRDGDPARYESAIYFTEVDEADRAALDAYVGWLRRAGQVA